jgi:hypothetical protein
MRQGARFRGFVLAICVGLAAGCSHTSTAVSTTDAAPPREAAAAVVDNTPAPPTGLMHVRRLHNWIAYVPPECFTKTRGADGKPRNPCYPCHTRSEAPNYVDDEDLQLTLKLPVPGAHNPWTNLITPPIERAPVMSDADVLAYVRQSNYFAADGSIALAHALQRPPPDWDGDGNGAWDGFVPDVGYAFDEHGFDHRADGTPTGWRAFAYYPFVGNFFPTNGSADDVLIRLDPALRQDDSGRYDARVYTVNLAIVEALVTRSDVRIDEVNEADFGVDLDRNGRIGRATKVAFDGSPGRSSTRVQYVGRARALEKAGQFPIAPGLFPLRTEFFHTVRYLDVGADGVVTMAPRMKEVRYARKAVFLTYEALKAHVDYEAKSTATNPDRTHGVEWFREVGVSNGLGWYYQGFIEAKDGSLRPQSLEESAFCEGCHGGIGATVDGIFSFSRKVRDDGPARGWFHWSQRDLRGLAEPKRRDGQYEYTLYLREAGAGDELRANAEVLSRFFDASGGLKPAEVEALHGDVARLLLPSAARALDLDRAYRAVVLEQSFDRGRDAVLAPSDNVEARPQVGTKTGIEHPVIAMRLAH